MRLTKEQNANYNEYLIDSIITYDGEVPNNPIKYFFEVFENEAGWNVERVGLQNAVAEWLSGLPSVISIPFMNWEILELAHNMGTPTHTEKEEDAILNNYWSFMANKLIKLNNKEK